MDHDFLTIGGKLLGCDRPALSSKSVLADLLGVDRFKLASAMPLLGCAGFHASRRVWDKLQEAASVRLVDADRILFLEFSASDETPLPVQTQRESGVLPTTGGTTMATMPSDVGSPSSLALASCTLSTSGKL